MDSPLSPLPAFTQTNGSSFSTLFPNRKSSTNLISTRRYSSNPTSSTGRHPHSDHELASSSSMGDNHVIEEGLQHVKLSLEARHYKTSNFAHQVLTIMRAMKIKSWIDPAITADAVRVHKVSGCLTNAVFFVSCPQAPHPPRTLLLRLYGPASDSLISRRDELHTLHVLSSRYGIVPRVFGTIDNGRVEEHFQSTTLTPADLRDPLVSRWIATRMADLHSVDIATVILPDTAKAAAATPRDVNGDGINFTYVTVTKNVASWLVLAQQVVDLPEFPLACNKSAECGVIDLECFSERWRQYVHWLAAVEHAEGASRRVFAHNDAQYGNLLRLAKLKEGTREHEQIIIVDFEYAGPNAAAFDIANHFIEWTSDYNDPHTPHMLHGARYPTRGERHNFYRAYLQQVASLSSPSPSAEHGVTEDDLDRLDRQVRIWRPASQAMWAVWALVQARRAVIEAGSCDGDNGGDSALGEFDYIGHARCRLEAFYKDVEQLLNDTRYRELA